MTQSSKLVKKKKSKIEKAKKNDKISELKQQPLPVDKRLEAEINLREMIKKAHQIHKDYVVRSSSNGLTPISSKISRSYSEKRKFPANNSYDEGSATRESLKKRIRTMKPENSSVTEVLPAKFRRKDLAQVTTGQTFSEESRKKQEVTPRINSDAFAMRKREIMALKRSSATCTVKENESNEVIARELAECGMKIDDYHIGTMPFVSLETIDKMKCQDWNSKVYPKKNLLRQKRRTERGYSATNLPKTKKKKCGKKTEIKEDYINEKNGTAENEKVRSSRVTKANPEKSENKDSELIPIPRESPCKTQLGSTLKAKSAVSSPKSVSSNFDRNLGTFSGAGDPFGSNRSHSYFSSDSDTSRIDKKFIQILKAVTQKNLNFDLDVKLLQRSLDTEKSKYGMQLDENGLEDHQQSELEQRLIKRINSLERKLGNTNTNVENPEKGEGEQEKAGDSVIVSNCASPVVEQLWIKDRTYNYSGVSLALNTDHTRKENTEIMSSSEFKKEVECDVTKIGKSYDSCKGDEIDRNLEQEQKGMQNPDSETPVSKAEESHTEAREKSDSKALEEVIIKDMSPSKVTPKSVSPSKDKNETPDTDARKDASEKPIETWSIIKRLEKAFQTLGLNLQDFESSDDSSSAKKKQTLIKKRVSFGKDKTNLHKMEAMEEVQEGRKSSSGKKRSKGRENSDQRDCVQYKVESNGSGDKNMDYKMVRSSKKVEDLKGECSTVKNTADTASNYTSDKREFQKSGYEEVEVGLSGSLKTIQREKYSERTMSENRIHGNVARIIVNNAHTGGLIMNLGGKKNLGHGKRLKNIHDDDLLFCRKSEKRRSEYSLSASCSLSSMSEEDEFKAHKRKKKNLPHSVESNTSNQNLREISTSGTGDATTQAILELVDRSIDWHIRKTKLNQSLPNPEQSNAQEMFQIEERNNELELKQIRERHKQIISEIKTSLNEIKKQHSLFAQLKTQTKKFHKDCHVKRKRIAAYLKEAEHTCESRKAREPFYESSFKYRRALSTDNYSHRLRRKSKLRKTSDCDLEVMSVEKAGMGRVKKLRRNSLMRHGRCDSVLTITATMDETSSNESSSVAIENSSTDFSSTDTSESFRTVATSIIPGRHNTRYNSERGKFSQMLSLEWNNVPEKPAWLHESTDEIPQCFLKIIQELNRIILTKNHRLDNLIKKASGSSNNSSHSGKTKASTSSKSSRSSKHHDNRMDEASRTSSTGYKTSSSNSSGKGGSKQHKSKTKGNKKFGREKPAEVDGGVPLSRSISLIQADPGGSSMDSIADREQEIVITESFPSQIQTDIVSLCPASCSHFDRQEEEFRYRKGDPSFQFRGQLLKCLDEHSKQCRRKTPEEERAYRRKMELERILRADEKTFKRPILFSRDSDGHALDFDSHNSGKEKLPGYVRHRQQSIIIDHNKGEENEESQTVLGHASRHSGVGRSKKAPHEYLKVDVKSESNYQTERESCEMWKKSGKKNQFEEVPVNYFEISLKNHESSADVSRDVDCQTDNAHDYEDIGDIYLWDESGSTHSIN